MVMVDWKGGKEGRKEGEVNCRKPHASTTIGSNSASVPGP